MCIVQVFEYILLFIVFVRKTFEYRFILVTDYLMLEILLKVEISKNCVLIDLATPEICSK